MSNNPDDYAFKQARRGGKTMLPIIQLIHEEDKRELISEFVNDLREINDYCSFYDDQSENTFLKLIEKWEEKL